MRKVLCLILVLAAAGPVAASGNARSIRETPVVKTFRAVRDAVVNISTTRIVESRSGSFSDEFFEFFNMPSPFGRRKLRSLGSGIVIHPSGYIVTNAHVVERATEVEVTFADKTTLRATEAYLDPEHDIVVLKVNPAKSLQALAPGRADDLMVGETVIAIGNALGYQHTVTTGVISAIGRTLEFRGRAPYRNLIQTDAPINPGNSGGPLLNINGELIGINTAIRGDAQNIGFAINIEAVKRLLPKLLDVESTRRVNLGFAVAATPDGRRVRVVSVHTDSPAQKSGIMAGDILTGYAAKPIRNPVDFYVKMLEHPTGRPLKLTVQRDGTTISVNMPFEVKPKPDGRRLARQKLGVELVEFSAQRARRIGLNTPLVVVESVIGGSPAQRVGLRRGDIIRQLHRHRTHTLDEIGEVLEQVRSGEEIYVKIIRPQRGVLYGLGEHIKVK